MPKSEQRCRFNPGSRRSPWVRKWSSRLSSILAHSRNPQTEEPGGLVHNLQSHYDWALCKLWINKYFIALVFFSMFEFLHNKKWKKYILYQTIVKYEGIEKNKIWCLKIKTLIRTCKMKTTKAVCKEKCE